MSAYSESVDLMTDLLMNQIEKSVETAFMYGENSKEYKRLQELQKQRRRIEMELCTARMKQEIDGALDKWGN